jgi:hypothetical protein
MRCGIVLEPQTFNSRFDRIRIFAASSANVGRWRNLPIDNPEKLTLFGPSRPDFLLETGPSLQPAFLTRNRHSKGQVAESGRLLLDGNPAPPAEALKS